MRLCITIVTAAMFACGLHGEVDQAWVRALNDGAKAKLVLHVVDQDRKPVADARVRCGFWRNYSDGGFLEFDLTTDSEGYCVVEGKCTGRFIWHVSKEGYYNSSGKWGLSDTKSIPKVVRGKWQPYGERRDILLKKMIAPFKASVPQPPGMTRLRRNIPVFGQWLPIDLSKLDWLPPYGNGKQADALIICNKRMKNFINDFEFSMTVSFTNNPYAGFYKIKKDLESEYQWEYSADSNAVFSATYQYVLKRDGATEKREELGEDECFVFRTRTKVDDSCNLMAAHYGVIAGSFCMGSSCIFLGDICFNETPNDTNIEDGYYLRKKVQRAKENTR